MKLGRIGVFAAATVGAVAFAAAPASAHATITFHGNDYGHVNQTHTSVLVYDGECDGWYAEVEFRYRNYAGGPIESGSVLDANDCSIGTNSRNRYQITSYRVCESTYGGANSSCTGWRTT